jgi:hypothetical protein
MTRPNKITVNVFDLENEIFGVAKPNLETAHTTSKLAEKYNLDIHKTELELGLTENDPRTFTERHPEVAERINGQQKVNPIELEKDLFSKWVK